VAEITEKQFRGANWPNPSDRSRSRMRRTAFRLLCGGELKFEFKEKAKSSDRVYRGDTVLEAFRAWLIE
jgi:hypothetical protein